MTESAHMKRVMMIASKLGARFFRNNVGQAFTGQSIALDNTCTVIKRGKRVPVSKRAVLINHPRRIQFGHCKGSSDLIGFIPVKITAEQVGRVLTIYTAVETKSSTGKPSAEQTKFLRMIAKNGGVAILSRDDDETEEIIKTVKSGNLTKRIHGIQEGE